MKNFLKYRYFVLCFTLVGVMLQGCIEDPPDIGEPFDRVSNLSGTWNLTEVIQNDEDAIRKGFPTFVQSLEVTELFPFTDLSLTLNVNEEGNPSTFTVTPGNSPNIFGAESGSWSLDDPDAPSEITFEGGITIQLDTYLGLTEGVLNLKLTRFETRSDGSQVAFLSYDYEFVKQ